MSEAKVRIAHEALIVEDDPLITATLVDLVLSLGHTARTAGTLEEALRELEKGAFCYVLLDMQIPASEGRTPLMSAGRTVLRTVRARFTARGATGAWALPIIVVTSYARDHEFVSEMYDDGASGFVVKPFEKGIDAVGAKILTLLERGDCSGQHGTGPANDPPQATPGPSAPHVAPSAPPVVGSAEAGQLLLTVPGSCSGRRTDMIIDGATLSLQSNLFVAALRFIDFAIRSPGQFQEKTALHIDRVPQIPSRLRRALREARGHDLPFIEGDQHGRFRLDPRMTVGHVAWDLLLEHGDETIVRVAREHLRRVAGR